MRYKIEINLLALKQMKSKINLEEAVLLDYLYWLCSSPSEEVEKMRIEKDGKKWTWFDYGFYLLETPIIRGKTKASITPKIKKLEEEGFIETILSHNEKEKEEGYRKYIRLLPKTDGLFRFLNRAVQKSKRGLFRKLNIDKYTTGNNNTTDNNNEQNEVLRITFKKEIDTLIEKFKFVNPTYERLFGNTTQRAALERLVKKFGKEKVENMIDYLPKIFGKKYAPRITSPYQLEMKMADLISYLQAEKSKVDDRKIVKI